MLAFGDRMKPEAAGVVRSLREAGIRVLLVSGDSAVLSNP
jgi:cation transport ATPase